MKLQDRWRQPFVVQFPHVVVQKGYMTDDRLRLFLASQTDLAAKTPSVAKGIEDMPQTQLTDEILQGESFAFLLDVIQHPDDGVRQRYARLGWSVDKGNRTKRQLLKAGLLESQLLAVGRTRVLVLRPTSATRRTLRLDKRGSIESIAHEFWKRRTAEKYTTEGWQVEVEGLRAQERAELGRADLVLTRGQERRGVEVETGKSNVVENVRQCLLAGLKRVVVVPVDEHARSKVEAQLATAGLLIRDRVQVDCSSGRLAGASF